jgi:hypothetical protein
MGSVGDLYLRKDSSATNPPIYAKLSGEETTTGWVSIAGAGTTPSDTIRPSTAVLALSGSESSYIGAVLALTGNQPSVRLALTLSPGSAALSAAGNQPTVVVA